MSASFIEMADGHHLEFLKTLDEDTRSSPWKFILDKVNGCEEGGRCKKCNPMAAILDFDLLVCCNCNLRPEMNS